MSLPGAALSTSLQQLGVVWAGQLAAGSRILSGGDGACADDRYRIAYQEFIRAGKVNGVHRTFFGQVPIMVVASVLVSFLVPQSTPRPLQLPSSPHESTSTKLAELDILGSILISSTILLLMLPLELGGQTLPWSHPAIFSLFGAALLAGLLFAKVERRAAEPVLPLQLFRNRDVVLSFAATLLQVAAQTGVMFTVPLYFQITTSVSMTEAGAHLVPAVVGNAVGGLLSGALIRRTGRYKGLVILGALCPTFGYLLMLLRWSGPINFWESLYIAPGSVYRNDDLSLLIR